MSKTDFCFSSLSYLKHHMCFTALPIEPEQRRSITHISMCVMLLLVILLLKKMCNNYCSCFFRPNPTALKKDRSGSVTLSAAGNKAEQCP